MSLSYLQLKASGARVAHLSSNDVLLGRVNGIAMVAGNRKYHRIIWDHKDEYAKTSRAVKEQVTYKVLQRLSAQTPPGRLFVTDAKKNGGYVEVATKFAIDKLCQALREKRHQSPYRTEAEVYPATSRGASEEKSASGKAVCATMKRKPSGKGETKKAEAAVSKASTNQAIKSRTILSVTPDKRSMSTANSDSLTLYEGNCDTSLYRAAPSERCSRTKPLASFPWFLHGSTAEVPTSCSVLTGPLSTSRNPPSFFNLAETNSTESVRQRSTVHAQTLERSAMKYKARGDNSTIKTIYPSERAKPLPKILPKRSWHNKAETLRFLYA